MCKSCGAMVEHRASERNASPAMSSIPGRSTFFHFFFQSWIYIILNFPALVIPRWKVKKAGISKLFFLFFTLSLYNPDYSLLVNTTTKLSLIIYYPCANSTSWTVLWFSGESGTWKLKPIKIVNWGISSLGCIGIRHKSLISNWRIISIICTCRCIHRLLSGEFHFLRCQCWLSLSCNLS